MVTIIRKYSIFKGLFLLVVFTAIHFFSFAQSPYLDSLKIIVRAAKGNPNVGKNHIKTAITLSDYYSKVSLDSAKFYGFAAYDISKLIGNDTGLAVSLNSIGMAYQICGYFDEALPYMDSARALFESTGNITGLIFVRNNLAVAMMRQGNYAEALKYYQENLISAQSRNELENMILAYNNMGITYFDWKKHDQALENYRLALKVLSDMNEEERIGPVNNNIGEVYFDMRELDSALMYFEKALQINQKYGKKRSILISTTNIGNVYFINGDFEKALKNYQQALDISKTIPDEAHIALNNIKIGQVLNELGKYKEANSFLISGLNISIENDIFNSVLEAYKGLIENAKGQKDANLVYKYGNLYISLKDSLFNENSLAKISELETKYKTAEKENEIKILKADQQVKELEIQLQKNLKYSLVIFLIIIISISFLLYNRLKLKKEKEKSEIERERLRIEQRLLHSQMNPHFIFNSLNSINSFIGVKNTTEAQAYLIKFAKLMRLILENSRKLMVPLADELKALELNMELEQLRFDNLFDFKINIDEAIDQEYLYIPPMLIQPFVENAILHGIKGNNDGGLVSLSISIEEDILQCIVEDNGIGREKSVKKNDQNPDHISLGTQVTLERIEIMRQEINPKSNIQIIDLKDDTGLGIGTKVILRIPYEEE